GMVSATGLPRTSTARKSGQAAYVASTSATDITWLAATFSCNKRRQPKSTLVLGAAATAAAAPSTCSCAADGGDAKAPAPPGFQAALPRRARAPAAAPSAATSDTM